MKIVLYILFVATIFVTPGYAEKKFDFRGSTWGSTIEEVKARETRILLEYNENERLLRYEIQELIYGLKARASYYFVPKDETYMGLQPNTLCFCAYYLQLEESDGSISDKYYEIRDILAKENGEPKTLDYWGYSKKLEDYDSMDDALSKKAVFLMSEWDFNNYSKGLRLTKSNQKYVIEIGNLYYLRQPLKIEHYCRIC